MLLNAAFLDDSFIALVGGDEKPAGKQVEPVMDHEGMHHAVCSTVETRVSEDDVCDEGEATFRHSSEGQVLNEQQSRKNGKKVVVRGKYGGSSKNHTLDPNSQHGDVD